MFSGEKMRARTGTFTILCATLALASCGDKSAPLGASSGEVKLDTFCAQPGLPAALRHTLIVVDTTTLSPAAPEELRMKNPELFKLVMGLADPQNAIETGAATPRERVTLIAASSRTGTLTPVFTGCIPGASTAELAHLQGRGGGGIAQKYFGSDVASQLRKQQSDFTRQLLLGLVMLNKLAEPRPAATDGSVTASPFVKLLKAIGLPGSDDPSVRRIFVFTDLNRSLPSVRGDVAEARASGFKAAADGDLRLGLAEVYVVSPGTSPDEPTEQFLDAFLLGSQGKLERAGGFSPSNLKPAPTQVVNYRGTLAATSTSTMPLTLRLATTREGQLVDSWITYTATFGQRATPVAGQFTCSAERDCVLKSDPAGGLGQLWRIKPGAEPEVREDAPFGGLRFLDAKEDAHSIQGRIFDPVISIGHPGGGMTFDATRM